MNHTENWIGSQYKKVVYREYTNGEFVEIKARPPQEQHLELLGMAQTAARAWVCTHTRAHTSPLDLYLRMEERNGVGRLHSAKCDLFLLSHFQGACCVLSPSKE